MSTTELGVYQEALARTLRRWRWQPPDEVRDAVHEAFVRRLRAVRAGTERRHALAQPREGRQRPAALLERTPRQIEAIHEDSTDIT